MFRVHDEDRWGDRRFFARAAIETDAVFSVVDDLIIPCATLAKSVGLADLVEPRRLLASCVCI